MNGSTARAADAPLAFGDGDRDDTGHWPASLSLVFARRGARTSVVEARHRGPLRVQRALYPEGDDVAHVVILHPPGGVVGGDTLRVRVAVGAGARAVVTTPAATKLYRSDGREARVEIICEVADGGVLEHLPQETIVFSGARARLHTRVVLHGSARYIGWEQTTLGRPACGETFDAGRVDQSVHVERDGAPVLIERQRYEGGGASLGAPWGLAGRPCFGQLVACDPDGLAPIDEVAAGLEDGVAGVTRVAPLVAVRAIEADAWDLRSRFEAAWALLRPALLGRAAVAPRIWRT